MHLMPDKPAEQAMQQQGNYQRQPKPAAILRRFAPTQLTQHRSGRLVQWRQPVSGLISVGRCPAMMFDLRRMNDDNASWLS